MSEQSWVVREKITNVDDLLAVVKLAERAERYEDMSAAIRQLAILNRHLDNAERNWLSLAYKNLVGVHRSSLRIAKTIAANKPEKPGLNEAMELVKKDLQNVCEELLKLLDETLIPAEDTSECKIFYWKLQGDYYRYLTEAQDGDQRDESAEKARNAYEKATKLAQETLPPCSATSLGLALNFSVFYYETMNSPDKACELAKAAFDEAITRIDELEGDANRDSANILQLIQDNLTLWNTDRELEKDEK